MENFVKVIIVKYSLNQGGLSCKLIKIKKLFENLNKNDIPFKTYIVQDVNDLVNAFSDKTTKVYLIIGHGRHYGVRIKKEVIEYSNLTKHIKGKVNFVAQLHCKLKSKNKKSLFELLNCDGFIPRGCFGIVFVWTINKVISNPETYNLIKKHLST